MDGDLKTTLDKCYRWSKCIIMLILMDVIKIICKYYIGKFDIDTFLK